MPSLRTTTLPILLLLAVACATTVVPGPEAERAIGRAEAAAQAGDWDEIDRVLGGLEGEACPRRLRDRRDLALARAHLGRGDLWDAYQVLEKFVDDNPHSDLRPQVGELVWQIGSTLAESDGGFLFFWSDRRAGRTALEHLITRHPDSPHGADALRILGDMAFDDEDYPLAQLRYRDLMLNHPDGEWFVHAQFRFAMSIVLSLEGPDYDLDRMEHATRELRQFLATRPEHPRAVGEAEQALAQITEWRADRHLRIAAFYRRVGNEIGYRQHLEIAAGPDFVGTTFQAEAKQALAELTPSAAPGARP